MTNSSRIGSTCRERTKTGKWTDLLRGIEMTIIRYSESILHTNKFERVSFSNSIYMLYTAAELEHLNTDIQTYIPYFFILYEYVVFATAMICLEIVLSGTASIESVLFLERLLATQVQEVSGVTHAQEQLLPRSAPWAPPTGCS